MKYTAATERTSESKNRRDDIRWEKTKDDKSAEGTKILANKMSQYHRSLQDLADRDCPQDMAAATMAFDGTLSSCGSTT